MQEEDMIDEIVLENSLQKKGLVPYIFDGYQLNLPHLFNAITIHLDGKLLSSLDWKKAKALAIDAIEKGFAIFWHLELGLFDQLNLPLINQTQFLSLALSLDHFKTSVWQEFAEHSIGVSIYRGQADFSLDFCWDNDQINNLRIWLQTHFQDISTHDTAFQAKPLNEIVPSDLYVTSYGKTLLSLYCRDVCVEYLSMLSSRFPDTIPCYLFLDATSLSDDLTKQVQLLNPNRFDLLHLALKGVNLPFDCLGWHSQATHKGYVGSLPLNLPIREETGIGVCLPLMNYHHAVHWKKFSILFDYLMSRHIPFRLISESHLITQWNGLDFLFYNPEGLSIQGKRKLQGFCAAGGSVISLGECLGLPYEMTFQQWQELNP